MLSNSIQFNSIRQYTRYICLVETRRNYTTTMMLWHKWTQRDKFDTWEHTLFWFRLEWRHVSFCHIILMIWERDVWNNNRKLRRDGINRALGLSTNDDTVRYGAHTTQTHTLYSTSINHILANPMTISTLLFLSDWGLYQETFSSTIFFSRGVPASRIVLYCIVL